MRLFEWQIILSHLERLYLHVHGWNTSVAVNRSPTSQNRSHKNEYAKNNKANLRDLIAATGLVILLKLDSNCRFPLWPWNLMDDLGKLWGTSSTLHQVLCIISNPSVNSNWSYCPGMLNSGQNRQFFVTCDQTFDGWPWKTIRQLFYATLSFVHHFKAINSKWRYSPETLNSGQNLRFFVPYDLEIWWMTLKNNRAPLLCCFKLVHHFIAIGEFKLKLQSGNSQFGSKSAIHCPAWPWNLTDDLEKQ